IAACSLAAMCPWSCGMHRCLACETWDLRHAVLRRERDLRQPFRLPAPHRRGECRLDRDLRTEVAGIPGGNGDLRTARWNYGLFAGIVLLACSTLSRRMRVGGGERRWREPSN